MRCTLVALLLVIAACTPPRPMPAPSSSAEFSLPEAAGSTLRVVSIAGANYADVSAGSGVAVATNVVLTNRHVVANALSDGLRFEIYVWDNSAGFPRPVNAIIASDARLDLAILYVRGIASTPATFALAPPNQLEPVTALGFPNTTDMVFGRLTATASATSGQVTAIDSGSLGDWGPADLLMHTASLNPGNSGGPLFNSCGQLAGINTMRGNPGEASSVFVASSVTEALPFLRSFGIRPTVASYLCSQQQVGAQCNFDRTALDQAVTENDLQAIDLRIREIPAECVTLRTEAWTRRATVADLLQTTFDSVGGRWRLSDQNCSQGVTLYRTGLSVLGISGNDVQIERFVSASNGAVTTRTIHPVGDDPTTYRYSVVDGRLKIENLSNNQSWELERCTG